MLPSVDELLFVDELRLDEMDEWDYSPEIYFLFVYAVYLI